MESADFLRLIARKPCASKTPRPRVLLIYLCVIRTSLVIASGEIERASLHARIPWYTYLYTVPFLALYPVFAYAYYVRYDDWIKGEEWTFLGCVTLGVGHALSFLVTRWSTGAKAWIETRKVSVTRTLNYV